MGSEGQTVTPTFAELAAETLRSELQDKVTELEGLLLSLEDSLRAERPPIEIIHLTLRHAHSLKGTLSMAEKVVAAHAVHAMESAFVSVRAGHLPLSRPLFDLAFAMVDQLTALAREDREDTAALEALFEKWQALVPADKLAPPKPRQGLPFPLSANELARLPGVLAGTQFLYLVEKTVLADCSREDFENLSILSDIASFGRLIARRPSFETLDRSYREAVILVLLATELPLSGVMERIYDPTRAVELSEVERSECLAGKTKAKGMLKSLVVEDDFTSRLLLQKMLAPYGEAHVAVDGEEALLAIQLALENNEPYDVICLDIMMPKLDGQATLKGLRQREENHGLPLGTGSKVVMTTALKDSRNVMQAFREQCDAYLVKPVDRKKLVEQLKRLGVLPA